MNKKRSQKTWAYKPSPLKFTAKEKEEILKKTNEIITTHQKISKKVSRVEMRTNRIYLYELVEQSDMESAVYIKPLIDGKYLEYPYARLTLLTIQGENCTADCQRYNNQWMTLYTGTLSECIAQIEDDNIWF